jgi:hypothetical protein
MEIVKKFHFESSPLKGVLLVLMVQEKKKEGG